MSEEKNILDSNGEEAQAPIAEKAKRKSNASTENKSDSDIKKPAEKASRKKTSESNTDTDTQKKSAAQKSRAKKEGEEKTESQKKPASSAQKGKSKAPKSISDAAKSRKTNFSHSMRDLKDSTAIDVASMLTKDPKELNSQKTSSIFNRPIFTYTDDTDYAKASATQSNSADEIVEVHDEALEMLLDLKIDEGESEFEEAMPEIFAHQSLGAIDEESMLIANIEAITDTFVPFADNVSELEELKETVDAEENAVSVEASAVEEPEDAISASEEEIVVTSFEESFLASREDSHESKDGEEESQEATAIDEESAEAADFEKALEEIEKGNEEPAKEVIEEKEEETETVDASLEESTEPEEESAEEEPPLPPLMDIEHFSDYLPKINDTSSDTDVSDTLAEDAVITESAAPTDGETLSGEEIESILENKKDEAPDFQQTFFEYKENLTILGDPTEKKKPTPVKKADPKVIRDEKKFDPQNPRMIDKRFDFVELFVFTLVAIMILTTFVFKHSVVEGRSMENTLFDGEHLIISNFFYTPEVGDIIVCEDYSTGHKKPLVKRIIALEGQTVRTDSLGNVYVDGVKLDEPYVNTIFGQDIYAVDNEWVVPEGEIFVLGDHRNLSSDSRAFGPVREDSILGKVVLRFYPFSEFGPVK